MEDTNNNQEQPHAHVNDIAGAESIISRLPLHSRDRLLEIVRAVIERYEVELIAQQDINELVHLGIPVPANEETAALMGVLNRIVDVAGFRAADDATVRNRLIQEYKKRQKPLALTNDPPVCFVSRRDPSASWDSYIERAKAIEQLLDGAAHENNGVHCSYDGKLKLNGKRIHSFKVTHPEEFGIKRLSDTGQFFQNLWVLRRIVMKTGGYGKEGEPQTKQAFMNRFGFSSEQLRLKIIDVKNIISDKKLPLTIEEPNLNGEEAVLMAETI